MKVYLEVSSWFKRYTSGNMLVELDLPEGAPAMEALGLAGLPATEVGIISINDGRADGATLLMDGDRIKVFPVIVGG